MSAPAWIIVERCTSHVGPDANPNNYYEHYLEFVQCLANVFLPVDVTLLDNTPTIELLEWLRDKKELKAFKGAKALWAPSNLEQGRHPAGEFPRIGAFEVYVLSSVQAEKGHQTAIIEAYSKLSLSRWPTPQFLASKIMKILGKVKRRDQGLPRCMATPLDTLGKFVDVHLPSVAGRPQSSQLLVTSMRVWIDPDIDGQVQPVECAPYGSRPLLLCDVTSGNRVRAVNLRQCGLAYAGAVEVAALVSRAPSLRAICLRDNKLDHQGVTALALSLGAATLVGGGVESLDLRGNRAGPAGATALAAALREDRHLTSLNVYGNGIGPEGAAALALALRRNRSLATLDLGDNGVTDAAASSLAAALRSNTTLTALQMQPLNALGPGPSCMGDPRLGSGCAALLDAARVKAGLQTLNLGASAVLLAYDPLTRTFPHKVMAPGLLLPRRPHSARAPSPPPPASVSASSPLPPPVATAAASLPPIAGPGAAAGGGACTRTDMLRRAAAARIPILPPKPPVDPNFRRQLSVRQITTRRLALYHSVPGAGSPPPAKKAGIFSELLQAHSDALARLSEDGRPLPSVGLGLIC